MTKASGAIGTGSLLTVGATTLVVATLALRNARRYVELAERRLEHLREEQTGLLELLREERRTLQEESKREREQRVELEQKAEWLSRELEQLRQKQGRLAQELERERARSLEDRRQVRQQAQEERERERRDAERRIDHLERELQELRHSQQERERRQAGSPPLRAAGASEDLPRTPQIPQVRPSAPQEVRTVERKQRPTSHIETGPSRPGGTPSQNKGQRLGVRLPHPDDDAGQERVSAPSARAGGVPVEMFRRYYDRYLENYHGYVELAEGLYQTRSKGGVKPGSCGEREWEERMQRVKDGIERTTARLDILEEHNPELATDDRISQRASVARRHSELGRNL